MKTRLALAMAAMLGATSLLAINALAQQPGAGPAPAVQAPQRAPQRPILSAEDRAALIDARIAGVKAGLRLTPEQEKLWPAVEQAVREGLNKGAELRARMQGQPRPGDMFERMRLAAEAMSARGEAMRKILEAGQPLHASLSEDQKRRLGLLMHQGPRGRMGPMQGMWNRGASGREDRPGMMGARPGDREGASRFERSPPDDRDSRGNERFGRGDRDSRDRMGARDPRGGERFGRGERDDREPRGGMGPRSDQRFDRRDFDERDRREMMRRRSEERFGRDGDDRRSRGDGPSDERDGRGRQGRGDSRL